MPSYFLDTSALAKRYHEELGSDFVDRLFQPPGSRIWISHLSIVEFESVLAIKVRTKVIDPSALEIARRRFRADLAQHRLFVTPPIYEMHFHRARRLLSQYGVSDGLRTLDALQLAAALDLRQSGHVDVLVAADQRLCRVSNLASCPAVNPDMPGPLLV